MPLTSVSPFSDKVSKTTSLLDGAAVGFRRVVKCGMRVFEVVLATLERSDVEAAPAMRDGEDDRGWDTQSSDRESSHGFMMELRVFVGQHQAWLEGSVEGKEWQQEHDTQAMSLQHNLQHDCWPLLQRFR